MEIVLFLVLICAVLAVGYRFVVASNRKTMEVGEAYLSGKSPQECADFVERPAQSLQTDQEIAAFVYLVMKPWKETKYHFLPLVELYERRDSYGKEGAEEMTRMIQAMGVNKLFAMLVKMAPLPDSLDAIASAEFGAWNALHKKTLEAEPSQSVDYFRGISSRAAANVLFARSRSLVR